jgi:hypothetical protein
LRVVSDIKVCIAVNKPLFYLKFGAAFLWVLIPSIL